MLRRHFLVESDLGAVEALFLYILISLLFWIGIKRKFFAPPTRFNEHRFLVNILRNSMDLMDSQLVRRTDRRG